MTATTMQPLERSQIDAVIGRNVEVTWVDDWEAPADTWTPISTKTLQGELTWSQERGRGADSAVPTLVLLPNAELPPQEFSPSDVVRIETPWGEEIGMAKADIQAALGVPLDAGDSELAEQVFAELEREAAPAVADDDIDLTKPFEWTLTGEDGDEYATVTWSPKWPNEVIADHPTDKMNYLTGTQALQYATALMQAARRVSLHAAAKP